MISSWEQFYNDENDNKIPDAKFERKVYNEERVFDREKIQHANAAYISNCIFESCSNSVNFAPTNENAQILVEFSLFRYCCSSDNGGALNVSNCDFLVNTICCYKCSAEVWGQSICTSLGDNKKNHVYRSSFSSDSQYSGENGAISLFYGNQECQHVNVSSHKTKYRAAIYYDLGSPEISKIKFCSIISNFATDYEIIITYNSGSSNLEISSSNIIDNWQSSTTNGIVECYKDTTISDCCILGNSGGYILHATTKTMTIINCKIQAGYSKSGNVVEQSTNNNLELTFVESMNDCLKIVDLKRNSMMCKCVDVSKLISLLTYVTYFLYLSN